MGDAAADQAHVVYDFDDAHEVPQVVGPRKHELLRVQGGVNGNGDAYDTPAGKAGHNGAGRCCGVAKRKVLLSALAIVAMGLVWGVGLGVGLRDTGRGAPPPPRGVAMLVNASLAVEGYTTTTFTPPVSAAFVVGTAARLQSLAAVQPRDINITSVADLGAPAGRRRALLATSAVQVDGALPLWISRHACACADQRYIHSANSQLLCASSPTPTPPPWRRRSHPALRNCLLTSRWHASPPACSRQVPSTSLVLAWLRRHRRRRAGLLHRRLRARILHLLHLHRRHLLRRLRRRLRRLFARPVSWLVSACAAFAPTTTRRL